MSKIIAIDFDSVLNNLLTPWINYLNIKHQVNIQEEDVTEWDMTKAFPTLNPQQVFEPLYVDDFWKHVKPLPGAYSTVHNMQKDGFNYYIVTDSNYQTLASKMNNCLLKYFKNLIRPSDVIVTSHKELILCDYIIDDYEENLKNNKGYRILIDKPYNRKANKCTYDFRANDITEAYEFIKVMEGITCTE